MLPTDIVVRKALVNGDGITNGGIMTKHICESDTRENIFSAAFYEQAQAGLIRYRKEFFHINTIDNQGLENGRIFIDQMSQGDDRVYVFPATHEDAQGDLTGTERVYGCGLLDANVSVGGSTITVAVEKGTDLIFRSGDKIRIFNGITRDFNIISNISWSADVATIILGSPLQNAYSRTDTIVSPYFEQALIKASVDAFTIVSAQGQYNQNVIELINQSTVFETWDLTFNNPSQYQCVGRRLGNIGTGNIATDFAPLNPDFNRAYFILRASGFSGTYQQGDKITVRTVPSACGVWYKQIIPPNTAGIGGNKFRARLEGVPS